ncbi:MAG: Hpt domain-containing protein, partial [Bacteriovoracaceae bacterium]|nr:Hpt domain-containing protein [Bacteriovoracaceae bacterium]
MNFNFKTKDDILSLHPSIGNFVPRYVENRKNDYAAFVESVNSGDIQAIRDYCHKVVGTARSYHFFQLEEITTIIQDYARDGDLEAIKSM